MINYKLLNKNKMKNYLSNRVGYNISEIEFQNCIDYIVDFVNYINEVREDEGKGKYIKEGASLEVDIKDDVIEVWVNYNFIWENEKEFVLVGFDYRR